MKIPDNWSEKQLGQILCQQVSGVSVLADERPPQPKQAGVLRLSCVTGGLFKPGDLKTPLNGQAARLSVHAESDTILISRSNTPALVGASAYVRSDFPRSFLPDTLWLLRPKDRQSVSMRWLAYVIGSGAYRRSLQSIASGTSQSMKKIQKGPFLKLVALTPPVPEQRKIADILCAWDDALEKLDSLIAAKDCRKRAIMQQVLTGRKRLRGFTKPWEVVPIGSLLKSADRYKEWDDDQTVRLAGVRRNGGGLFFRAELPASEIKVKTAKIIHADDFLISRRQITYGGMAIVPRKFHGFQVNDEYEVLVPLDPNKFDIRFFGQLAHTPRLKHLAYLASNGFFAERLRLNFDLPAFLESRIHVPTDAEEQRAIVDLLHWVADELVLLRNQRQTLDQQKRGLMQRLLTGQIRVTTS